MPRFVLSYFLCFVRCLFHLELLKISYWEFFSISSFKTLYGLYGQRGECEYVEYLVVFYFGVPLSEKIWRERNRASVKRNSVTEDVFD